MSRMKSRWNLSSLNGSPWPIPDGTVSCSMKSMTRFARSRPSGVRLTGEEPVELARRALRLDGRDAGSCSWSESKLTCVPHHIVRRLPRSQEQRVLHDATVARLNHERAHHWVARGHLLELLDRRAPRVVCLAVGSEGMDVEHGQQLEPIELRDDALPLRARVAGQIFRRLRWRRREHRLRLLAVEPLLTRIAAQHLQVGRNWARPVWSRHLITFVGLLA